MSNYQLWRYADREAVRAKRSKTFLQDAQAGDQEQRLDLWRVADEEAPKTKGPGESYARQFDDQQKGAYGPSARPKGGGNPFSKALGAAKDFGGDVFDATMTTIGAPQKYVGAPLFGTLTGLNKSETY